MPILDWFNKKEALKTADKTPYKVLVENKELSYGDQTQGNMLIKGDNLEALKALLPYYKGRVKCIYIDPPYNTGKAFEQYDDNVEHSIWLSLMYARIELLRELLREDGVLFASIDDREEAYFKVLVDEIFGRSQTDCFIWRKSGAGRDGKMKNTTTFRKDHEYIIVAYKKIKNLKKSFEKPQWENSYPNLDNDPRGGYKAGSISRKESASNPRHPNFYTVVSPGGKRFSRQFDVSEEEFKKLNADNRIYWGKNGNSVPAIKIFENEERETNTSSLILFNGTSTEGKKEIEALFGDIDAFDTPKPESLIKKLLQIASDKGDLILDSFLGSGTTAAVAHKMGRRYIGIEMKSHATTLCVPRLKKVIDGQDPGGISEDTNWKGGGGFTFYDLGNPIFDEEGNINHGISFKDLAFHVWFSETKTPMQNYKYSPLLGVHKDTAYYLLYNGVLGDKRVNGGNVLTSKVLESLPPFDGPKVIYGESCRLSPERLKKENIIFKQTPYEITAR